MDINGGVLKAIGHTPIIRLNKAIPDAKFQLYMKMEGLNPGGSAKDRSALSMMRQGISEGKINHDTVIIESSSGNLGISLAQICRYLNLRFICVVDRKTTDQNLKILRAYGVEIDMIDKPDPISGEYLKVRIDRVNELLRTIKGSYRPNQYANIYNPKGHYQTMAEIANAFDNRVDYVFCATSTCGTMRGCVEYVREHDLKTKVIAVDAIGSVIFGGTSCKRIIPGHGAAITPALYEPDLVEEYIQVSDADCVRGCRKLMNYEGVLAGGSTGAILTAIEYYKDMIEDGATCVMIMHDKGERYLDTIYSNEWVREKLGEIFTEANQYIEGEL